MTARCVVFAMLTCVLLLSACNRDQATLAAPGAPSSLPLSAPSLPLPPASNVTYWIADGTVSSVTGPRTCSGHLTVGQTMANWAWRITITSEAILLEQDDMGVFYLPFAGTLSDRQFTATYTTGTDNGQSECRFKGGTLDGSFSEDFSSFEAVQTLVYASPAGDMTVQWRLIGTRCPNC